MRYLALVATLLSALPHGTALLPSLRPMSLVHRIHSSGTERRLSDVPISLEHTQLPDSFDDAVARACKCSLAVIRSGSKRVRIDFDTSVGDMTYTSLQNTLPMMKSFARLMSESLDLYPLKVSPIEAEALALENAAQREISGQTEVDLSTEAPPESMDQPPRTMRVFFPDMGAAVLARRDWKLGGPSSELPPCVLTANVQNDLLEESDEVAVILCPLSYEADYVKRVIEMCNVKRIPCIMINPNLINMDQGFGVRARNMRETLINTFTVAYKLKTTSMGAIVREWPSGFSVWIEDSSKSEGYRLLQSYSVDPPGETVMDLYDENAPVPDEPKPKIQIVQNVAKELSTFFKGLSRL